MGGMMKDSRKTGYVIRTIVGRIHVATPYEEVAREIMERTDGKGMDRRLVSRSVTDAVIQHRRNRAEYAWIMGSH
jgi:hypothetical protein